MPSPVPPEPRAEAVHDDGAAQLRHEIRQTRPFRTPGQAALVALMRTSDVIRRELAAVIEPHGITLQQYNVLRILRGAGEAGLPTLEIAHRMIEEAPGITRLLDRLEDKGLVARERCRADRRQVLCHLRSAGLELLAGLDEPVGQADARLLGRLSTQDQQTLLAFLDRIRAPRGARSNEEPVSD